MKKDTMTMRKEWFFEVLDALEMLKNKTETKGEDKIMHELAKTLKNNIDFE